LIFSLRSIYIVVKQTQPYTQNCNNPSQYSATMSRPTAQQLDQLYKQTLAASKRFASYNFREYFVRRTNERFTPLLSFSGHEGKIDASLDQKWWESRVRELDVLKRAGEVNRMFQGPKMVIEHARPITGRSGMRMCDCKFGSARGADRLFCGSACSRRWGGGRS
jgi:hypothetical protein